MVFSGFIIVVITTTWDILYIIRKAFKYGFKQGSKVKLKKPRNRLKKLNSSHVIRKIFKSKPKVEFIPVK